MDKFEFLHFDQGTSWDYVTLPRGLVRPQIEHHQLGYQIKMLYSVD